MKIEPLLEPGQTVYAFGGIFYHIYMPVVPCEVVNIRVGKDLYIKYYIRPLCEEAKRHKRHIITTESSIGKTIFTTKEAAEQSYQKSIKGESTL